MPADPPADTADAASHRHPWSRVAILLGGLAVLAVGLVVWAASRDGGAPRPPLPPGAVAIDVWAPFWTLTDTIPELEGRLTEVREASPFWFGARGVTEIVVDEQSNAMLTADFLDAVRDAPVALVPSIRDEMGAGEMAAILADPAQRAAHVQTLLAFARGLDADGLDLDYEQFAFADGRSTWEATRPNWVAFIAELAAALHDDDRTLTVTIPPVYDDGTTDASGYWVYDHGAIAAHVDAIRIMGYDYSVNEPGPIAPLDWVRRSVAGVSAAVPEELHHKLVLGVPAYGTNWVTATEGACPATAEGRTTVTIRTVAELARRRQGTPEYDPGYGEWTFSYELAVDGAERSCVQSREVRWVGAEGVAERAAIAREARWGGVALWALGYEDDAAWRALVEAAQAVAPAVTTTP